MINFSAYSIRNPLPSILLFIVLTLWGLFSFYKLKVQDFPDIDLPMVTVNVAWTGASPDQMESEVVRKIEGALSSVNGIKNVYASILDGTARVMVEFILEKDGNEGLDDVRNAVTAIRGDLPASINEPQVAKIQFTAAPILAYTINSSRMDEEELSWFIENSLIKKLQGIAGIGTITRVGGVNREIKVELDLEKLQALKVSLAEISTQIKNISQEFAGGLAKIGDSEQSMRTIGSVKDVDELRQLPIVLYDGRVIKLGNIAKISDDIAEIREIAEVNGNKVIGIEITRAKGANPIELSRAINTKLQQISSEIAGLTYTKVFDMVEYSEEDYRASMLLLFEGSLLAVLVVWIFLRNLRSTLITCVSLPLSIIPTYIGLRYFGFSLNMVTLLAIGLVVGILVDDAIVEIENIIRHLKMGKTPYQAAMEASDEIGLAVIATSLTIIAVFLPTAFMDGISGKFFKQFGWTASIAVFFSLIVARLLIPMMAAYLIKPIPENKNNAQIIKNENNKFHNKYLQIVNWCLQNRKTTIFSAIVFFIFSIGLVALLPSNFMNGDDAPQTAINIELPPGAKIEDTYKRALELQQLVVKIPDVKLVYLTVGGGKTGADVFAGGVGEVRKAQLAIRLADRSSRHRSKRDIDIQLRELTKQIDGIRFSIGLGQSGGKYNMAISSDDPELLSATAQKINNELQTLIGVGSIISNASILKNEVVIRPNSAQAAQYGVTTAEIAQSVRLATIGDYDMFLPKLNLSQRQIPIVVKLSDDIRNNLQLIKQLPIRGAHGFVMLSEVAEVNLESGPAQINRRNRERSINYEIELNGRALGEVKNEIDNLPTMKNLPKGVNQVEFGDAEELTLLINSFLIAMATGTICILIVLILLFRDLYQPISILMALPLSFGGSFLALLITGNDFSMPSMIGLIMLMGIATKNSILLIEYAITARSKRGLGQIEAVIDACSKRARPIIMTSIAMSAGMLPSALGLSGDPTFRAPMAISVIGGLVTSTFLSLLIIPVVYVYMDDLQVWIKNIFKTKKQ